MFFFFAKLIIYLQRSLIPKRSKFLLNFAIVSPTGTALEEDALPRGSLLGENLNKSPFDKLRIKRFEDFRHDIFIKSTQPFYLKLHLSLVYR